jgi:hypothetical protein
MAKPAIPTGTGSAMAGAAAGAAALVPVLRFSETSLADIGCSLHEEAEMIYYRTTI